MIKYMRGNYFLTPAKVLVNTVNTVGVMGKGIALQFKKMYPDMFNQYQKFCDDGLLTVGKLWLYKTDNKWILNFPTKINWRNKSKLSYIEAGLQKFVETYQQKGITSIAFPELGCGNGGLDWKDVKPLMEKYLMNLPIDIYIYEKKPATEQEYLSIEETKNWIDQLPSDIPFAEFCDDLKGIDASLPYSDESFIEALHYFWNYFKDNSLITQHNQFFDDENVYQSVYSDCEKLKYIQKCELKTGNNYSSCLQLKPAAAINSSLNEAVVL